MGPPAKFQMDIPGRGMLDVHIAVSLPVPDQKTRQALLALTSAAVLLVERLDAQETGHARLQSNPRSTRQPLNYQSDVTCHDGIDYSFRVSGSITSTLAPDALTTLMGEIMALPFATAIAPHTTPWSDGVIVAAAC